MSLKSAQFEVISRAPFDRNVNAINPPAHA